MQNTDDILGQPVTSFVDRYVRSLLTWDVIVFFHRNPDQVLYLDELGARLGRSVEELSPEVANLCGDRILRSSDSVIAYDPDPGLRDTIAAFVDACQEKRHRLALIAAVLQRIGPT